MESRHIISWSLTIIFCLLAGTLWDWVQGASAAASKCCIVNFLFFPAQLIPIVCSSWIYTIGLRERICLYGGCRCLRDRPCCSRMLVLFVLVFASAGFAFQFPVGDPNYIIKGAS